MARELVPSFANMSPVSDKSFDIGGETKTSNDVNESINGSCVDLDC